MPFAPPLEIDRGPLLAVRVDVIRTQIRRAKTSQTVERAVARVKADREIGRSAKAELVRYAVARIASLGDGRVVRRRTKGRETA
jgi:hypothetical protein